MHAHTPHPDEREPGYAAIRAALLASYCNTLSATRLDPLDALGLVVRALGSIYAEVAEAHFRPGGCPCGWQPDPQADIALMQRLLAAGAAGEHRSPHGDLGAMPPAGNA